MTDPRIVDVYVSADIFVAGYSDDGMPYTAEVFYVQAEAANGQRWDHGVRFPACIAHACEDEPGQWFENVKAQAEARAERLAARIRAAGMVLDLAHWSEGRPAYGSAAYSGEDEVALEKREAEAERWGDGGELRFVA